MFGKVKETQKKYEEFVKPYIEQGKVTELYATKDFSIVNICDMVYALVDKNIFLDSGDGYCALEANPKYIDSIIELGYRAHLISIRDYGETKLSNYIFSFGEEQIEALYKKHQAGKVGRFIDKDYEAHLRSITNDNYSVGVKK